MERRFCAVSRSQTRATPSSTTFCWPVSGGALFVANDGDGDCSFDRLFRCAFDRPVRGDQAASRGDGEENGGREAAADVDRLAVQQRANDGDGERDVCAQHFGDDAADQNGRVSAPRFTFAQLCAGGSRLFAVCRRLRSAGSLPAAAPLASNAAGAWRRSDVAVVHEHHVSILRGPHQSAFAARHSARRQGAAVAIATARRLLDRVHGASRSIVQLVRRRLCGAKFDGAAAAAFASADNSLAGSPTSNVASRVSLQASMSVGKSRFLDDDRKAQNVATQNGTIKRRAPAGGRRCCGAWRLPRNWAKANSRVFSPVASAIDAPRSKCFESRRRQQKRL